MWSSGTQCHEIGEEKIMLKSGKYNQLYIVQSKEFRELLKGNVRLVPPKLDLNFDLTDPNDTYVVKSYFGTIKRLANTRHKNTLLRVWNGDCLSNTRLIHMNLTDTDRCPNCAMLDTPLHVLVECNTAQQVWSKLMVGIPKSNNIEIIDYALGISDPPIALAIKAETLKMLMHFRDLNPNAILRRLKDYFLTVQGSHPMVRWIFELL